jgi:hypothetical protein
MWFKSGPGVSIGVAVICVVGAALPMWAHHSHGNYEDTAVYCYRSSRGIPGSMPRGCLTWRQVA